MIVIHSDLFFGPFFQRVAGESVRSAKASATAVNCADGSTVSCAGGGPATAATAADQPDPQPIAACGVDAAGWLTRAHERGTGRRIEPGIHGEWSTTRAIAGFCATSSEPFSGQ